MSYWFFNTGKKSRSWTFYVMYNYSFVLFGFCYFFHKKWETDSFLNMTENIPKTSIGCHPI